MEIRTFSIGEVLSDGWDFFKKNWMLAFFLLAVCIIFDFMSSMFVPDNVAQLLGQMADVYSKHPEKFLTMLAKTYSDITFLTGNLISSVLQMCVMAGLLNVVIMVVRGDRAVLSIDGFAMPAKKYLQYMLLQILYSIIVIVGFVCFILPGIWLILRLCFAGTYLLDNENAGVIESMRESFKMTRGNSIKLLGLCFIFVGIAIFGLFCFCVGILGVLAYMQFCMVVTYFKLKDEA